MKKTAWPSLSLVCLLGALCGPADATAPTEAPTVALTVATAATTLDPGQDRALLATAAAPLTHPLVSTETTAPETGWRERLALLGAAVLALLFILRRQWAQRMGDTWTRSPDSVEIPPPPPTWHPPTRSGLLLSQLDNLPAPDDDTFEVTPVARHDTVTRRKRGAASRRTPSGGRRKPRVRAEAP